MIGLNLALEIESMSDFAIDSDRSLAKRLYE